MWDLKSKTIRELRGHSHVVQDVKFVLGGARLASASWDGTIRLWDVNEEPPPDKLEGCAGPSPIAFDSQGARLATVNSNATALWLWSATTGAIETGLALSKPETEAAEGITLIESAVHDLAFSPDGVLAVARSWQSSLAPTSSRSRRVELWDLRRRIMTNSLSGQAPLCFSRDGHWLAYQSTNEGVIQFHDRHTGRAWTSQGEFIVSPEKHEFMFSPDGRRLVSCGWELVLWETATGKRLETLLLPGRDKEPPINTVAFSPDGRWLIAAGAEIRIWDVTNRRWVSDAFPGHLARIRDLASSPDGKTLVSGDWNGEIKLWHLEPPDGRSNQRGRCGSC